MQAEGERTGENPKNPLSSSNATSSSLKRSSSDASCNSLLLDCQSLQSSLKRVRLSCSPGELRLQRDLRSLITDGWSQPQDQVWLLEGIAKLEQVTQHDPLRLLLAIQQQQQQHHHHDRYHHPHGALLWIQIPRMYPHRPPVISRLESPTTNIQRIVVTEAPPLGQDWLPPSTTTATTTASVSTVGSSCGTTIVYNQWSPVMRLGDLIQFLLQLFTHPSDIETMKSSPSNTFAGGNTSIFPAPSFSSASSSASTSTSTSSSSAASTSSSTSQSPSTVPLNHTAEQGHYRVIHDSHHASNHDRRMDNADLSYNQYQDHKKRLESSPSPTLAHQIPFVEEHKMDDSTPFWFPISRGIEEQSSSTLSLSAKIQNFLPNRFDVGYGKYYDPLANSMSTTTTTTTATTTRPTMMVAATRTTTATTDTTTNTSTTTTATTNITTATTNLSTWKNNSDITGSRETSRDGEFRPILLNQSAVPDPYSNTNDHNDHNAMDMS